MYQLQKTRIARSPGMQLPTAFWSLTTSLCCVALISLGTWMQTIKDCSGPFDLIPSVVLSSRCNGQRRDSKGRSPNNQPVDPSIPCGSYSRYSSSLQSDDSIVDQQRKCHEKAEHNGHLISPEFEFFDEAISGTKRHRAGLDAMLSAAHAKRIKVLYFHSLSRLSRESVITLPLLKNLVYNCGVRIISVTEGIDSNVTGWDLNAHIMSIVHEQFLKGLAANVLRGQEGTVLAGRCAGDYCFGFSSEAIPGTEKGGRGRNAKPQKMYVIGVETAAWVSRIFHWFVNERRSLRWITQELNRLGAPKDHRAKTKEWRHQYLPKLLRNRKYIGRWSWGQKQNVRDPLTGKVRQVDRPLEESDKWLRHLPHLQIIDNATFEAAERLLKENDKVYADCRKERGKFVGSTPDVGHHQPRHLLSGLIRCKECGRTFYVGGAHGKYLFCPGYKMGTCSCKTQLRRDLAEKKILDEIGRRILASAVWRQDVIDELVKSWKIEQSQLPSDLAAAEKALADVERRIDKLVDQVEDGQGGPELNERLIRRRMERKEWVEKLERLRRADQNRCPMPTETWVDEQICHLGEVLLSKNPAGAHALRDLVGDQIVVTEIRKPGRERHFLQGRFVIRTAAVVKALLGRGDDASGTAASGSEAGGEDIVIDFHQPAQYELESEKAKELLDKGWLMVHIAQEMGRQKSYVRKLIKHWFESRGLPVPDGRSRRSMLAQKHQDPPMFEALAAQVEVLLKEGILIQEMAQRLGCCRDTVTKVIEHLRTVSGLSIPDGRTRRKTLNKNNLNPEYPGMSNDIAATI